MKSNYKELFYQSLEDLFVGAEVEGQGGYVNLLKIKRKYYNKVVQKLKELVQEKLEGIEDFEQELYEKLWTFFKRYFSEVGSIYFKETSYPQSVYERFYEDKDVVLFWKTKDLYYIKTDRLFRSNRHFLSICQDKKIARFPLPPLEVRASSRNLR